MRRRLLWPGLVLSAAGCAAAGPPSGADAPQEAEDLLQVRAPATADGAAPSVGATTEIPAALDGGTPLAEYRCPSPPDPGDAATWRQPVTERTRCPYHGGGCLPRLVAVGAPVTAVSGAVSSAPDGR